MLVSSSGGTTVVSNNFMELPAVMKGLSPTVGYNSLRIDDGNGLLRIGMVGDG